MVRIAEPRVARALAGLLCVLVAAGCAGPRPGITSGASATLEPSATPTTAPITSTAACGPFDLSRASQPVVALHRASEPDRNEISGLNGSGALGATVFDAGPWHQPSPEQAVAVSRGDALLAGAYFDVGELPLCLSSVVVDAAPFSPLGVAPDTAALVRLGTSAGEQGSLPAFRFDAPTQPGEWVVRVALTFQTDPGPSRQESFFRLRVDAPAPEVAGGASAPVACGQAGADPPGASLAVDGGAPIKAAGSSFTWGTTSADGPPLIGPRVVSQTGATLVISTEDNLCAGWWLIQLAPRPASAEDAQEPFIDLVPAHVGGSLAPGSANRFTLGPIPPGDWVVEATLEFDDGNGALLGETTNFWNVAIQGSRLP